MSCGLFAKLIMAWNESLRYFECKKTGITTPVIPAHGMRVAHSLFETVKVRTIGLGLFVRHPGWKFLIDSIMQILFQYSLDHDDRIRDLGDLQVFLLGL